MRLAYSGRVLQHGIERLHHRLRLVRGDRKLALARLDRELGQRVDVVAGDADDRRAERLELRDRLGEVVRFDRAALRIRRREEVEDDRPLLQGSASEYWYTLPPIAAGVVKSGARSPMSSAARAGTKA